MVSDNDDVKASRTVIGYAIDAGVEITPEVEALAKQATRNKLEAAKPNDETMEDVARREFKQYIPLIVKTFVALIIGGMLALAAWLGIDMPQP